MKNARSSLFVLLWIVVLIFMLLAFAPAVAAQRTMEQPGSENAVCSFDDGKAASVRYVRAPANGKDAFHLGKLWTPGGNPIFLFTETRLSVGDTDIPAGAYSIFLVPGREEWTLIVSSNVSSGTRYDERQDLVRARMQTGELNQAEGKLVIYFGRVGPRECDMRLDFGKTRAWIEFKEK